MSRRSLLTVTLLAASLVAASRGHAQPEPAADSEPAQPPSATASSPDAGVAQEQPTAPDPAPPAPDESFDLTTLGIESTDQAVDQSFHFGGFADFTAVFPIRLRGVVSLGVPTKQTFYIGNANIYVSKNISSYFRAMGEVRFTYLPGGAISFDPQNIQYISTEVYDYADNSRVVRWGGIIMQRLYLEGTIHRIVAVRIGQFLTPYGIWNVDHGSPVYIPVQRPYVINSHYFPERQTGLELFGRWDASNHTTLGYHLTLSNGGGAISEYHDLDKNKALGARLYLEHQAEGFFRLGASAYYGQETNAQPKLTFAASSLGVGEYIEAQYYALAFAADITYTLHGLRLQAEWVSQQRKYTNDGRTARAEYFAPVATGFPSNSLSWAAYALAAYTIPWFALTPYLMYQHAYEVQVTTLPDFIINVNVFTGGVSIRPDDAVVFKAEYQYSTYTNGGPVLDHPTNFVQLQAAWAF